MISERTLGDSHVLIAEDEWLFAAALDAAVVDAGATVVGPVASLAEVLELVTREVRIDGAILDVNLRGEMVFPAADLLAQRGVPYVFTTGYDFSVIPKRFEHVVRCEKPVNIPAVVRALADLIRA